MSSSKENMWSQPSNSADESSTPPPDNVPDWLGNLLRTMFSEVMDEPVPDEFQALLNQLDEKEKGKGDKP